MNRRLIEILVLIAVTCAAVSIFPGCGALKNQGSPHENIAPICSLVNTPTDEAVFSRNEPIYWYAVDEDGVVVKYKYSVMRMSDLPIDPATGAPSIQMYIDSSRAAGFNYKGWDYTIVEDEPKTSTGSATNEKVRLFAVDDCDTCRLEQVFFIVALDNLGAWSNVPYRIFFRTNHPPDTRIKTKRLALFGPHFAGTCIEGLKDVGNGIRVSWEGSDLLDYTGRQPDFEYEWKVFGPFDSIIGFQEKDVIDSLVDYSLYTKDEDLVVSSCEDECWTMRTSTSLFNLFQNEEAADSTISGYFVFSVRTRDDAFVPDPTPANGIFKAIQPACERQILLIDNTAYWLSGGLCGEVPCGTDPSTWHLFEEKYKPYFKNLVEEASGDNVDYYHRLVGRQNNDPETDDLPPSSDLISKYKLVIFFKESIGRHIELQWMQSFASYLNIGGKVMVFSPTTFVPRNDPIYSWESPGAIAAAYFNIQGERAQRWRLCDPNNVDNPCFEAEQFTGALATPSAGGLPDSLRVDWDGHLKEYVLIRGSMVQNPWMGINTLTLIGVPGVVDFRSLGQAEGLYRMTSAYGDFGIQNGGLCAFRYETGLLGVPWFKSAVFGFPIYSLKREDEVALLRGMIEWFDIN